MMFVALSSDSAQSLDEHTMSMWTAISKLFMERIDDLIFAELLIISFFFSLIMRAFKQGFIREYSSGFMGIALLIYIAEWKIIYSLIIVMINIFLYRTIKNRYLPLSCFLTTFIYLGFLRVIHFFGFAPLVSHVNAAQLIITLRLVGLSFEIQDARCNTKERDADTTRCIREPTYSEALLYSYSFAGLFTGPYYTYAMHRDVMDNDDIMEISVLAHLKWRFFNLLWTFPAFLVFVYAFPLQMMREKQFYDETVFYRIYTSVMIFFWMRCRVYSAWMVAESICILNRIGVYPRESMPQVGRGPTKNFTNLSQKATGLEDVEYDSEAVRNLNIWDIEFNPSFRGGIRAWNRSVQFWLAYFVYKRVPRAIGMVLTMSVSAFWHGVHPGYYLSFLTVPLCTLAEDMIFSIVSTDASGRRPLLFDLCWYVVRQLSFALMASGFLLLTWSDTIRYWNSVHFYVHFIMGPLIVCTWLYKMLHIISVKVCQNYQVDADKEEKIGRVAMKLESSTLKEKQL